MAAPFINTEKKLSGTFFFFSHLVCFQCRTDCIANVYLYTSVLSRANYHVTCFYMRLWANHANDNNRCAPLAFPTHKWNVVNSNVTSFPAQNSDFRGKWNAPLYIYPSAQTPPRLLSTLSPAVLNFQLELSLPGSSAVFRRGARSRGGHVYG